MCYIPPKVSSISQPDDRVLHADSNPGQLKCLQIIQKVEFAFQSSGFEHSACVAENENETVHVEHLYQR